MDESSDSIAELCAAHGLLVEQGRFAPGMVFGDWRLTAFIGRGGNGEVYCAEHIALGTPAAVKVLTREENRSKERFAREASFLSRMKSAAFPRFFAYGEANGSVYLAMELLEPGELPANNRSVARFMLKVCDAVAELHSKGFIHRDIKPGNILWREGGEPVLVDLGLVKNVEASAAMRPDESLTIVDGRRAGVGTPGYGAPEQIERGEATVASDIHALGVLADRCFGGRPPRAWKRIIERATSSIPARRYPSVAALARAIRLRHLPKIAVASVLLFVIIGLAVALASADRERMNVVSLMEGLENIRDYNSWYAQMYGAEQVEEENNARIMADKAARDAREISALRSNGRPIADEEYARLENGLANIAERLEFFRKRWQEKRAQWKDKVGHPERAAIETKPVTIQLLEEHEKTIRSCLDAR